jgi:hypothetical protein
MSEYGEPWVALNGSVHCENDLEKIGYLEGFGDLGESRIVRSVNACAGVTLPADCDGIVGELADTLSRMTECYETDNGETPMVINARALLARMGR